MNETSDPVLHIKYANRHHGGNYSCEGLNAAGWSHRPKSEELIVHCKISSLELHESHLNITVSDFFYIMGL